MEITSDCFTRVGFCSFPIAKFSGSCGAAGFSSRESLYWFPSTIPMMYLPLLVRLLTSNQSMLTASAI